MTPIDPDMLARCAALARQGPEIDPVQTGLAGVSVVRATAAADIPPRSNPPMVCLVLQGAKEILHHDRSVRFGAGETAIVSHDLVARARIVAATPAAPYLAVASEIDVSILRDLEAEIDPRDLHGARAAAVTAGTADPGVIETMRRLLTLIDRPLERQVILPLIRRELHFRVLLSRQGAMLRQLARHDSAASRIARAIAHIRAHWSGAIRTEDLAALAGMSLSSFHGQFQGGDRDLAPAVSEEPSPRRSTPPVDADCSARLGRRLFRRLREPHPVQPRLSPHLRSAADP